MSEKSSLTLIVPCYNEIESIPHFESELTDFFVEFSRHFPSEKFSVVIVDNNSTDGSRQRLDKFSAKHEFVSVVDCSTPGYGAALKCGFAAADAHYLAFLDLDNTYPMSSLLSMLELLRREKFDMIYGARIHSGSKIPWVRSLGNQMYVVLLRWLLKSPLTDVCSGMRVFRSEHLPRVLELKENDLSFSIAFTAMSVLQGWKLAEIPIAYRDRVGESKLSVVKDGVLFLWVVLRKWKF